MKPSPHPHLILALCFGLLPGAAQASLELADKAGCTSCHALDQRKMGPAFREVAKKYQADTQAFAQLRDKVRQGGRGVWGRAPMPPYGPDKISDADLDAVLRWVLDLAKAAP